MQLSLCICLLWGGAAENTNELVNCSGFSGFLLLKNFASLICEIWLLPCFTPVYAVSATISHYTSSELLFCLLLALVGFFVCLFFPGDLYCFSAAAISCFSFLCCHSRLPTFRTPLLFLIALPNSGVITFLKGYHLSVFSAIPFSRSSPSSTLSFITLKSITWLSISCVLLLALLPLFLPLWLQVLQFSLLATVWATSPSGDSTLH